MGVEWKPGDRIEGAYEVLDVREGGMGRVYIVYDHVWRIKLAAKTFRDDALASDPSIVKRFRREALTWINLDPHPNIATALFSLVIHSKPYIFLEYIAGGDLSAWIGTQALTLPQTLLFTIDFCDGMEYAYSRGIVAHRDVKPHNCLISDQGQLKITDFGLASVLRGTRLEEGASTNDGDLKRQPLLLSARLTQQGIGLGTLPYMAPEQIIDARAVDGRADIYALGIMLFEMTTGNLPFYSALSEDWVQFHLLQPMPNLDRRYPAQLDALIQQCTQKRASDRPASFGIVRRELINIYESITEKKPPSKNVAPVHPNQIMRKGIGLASLGEVAPALECFERALAIDPSNAVTWVNKAHALDLLGRKEEAVESIDRALENDPGNAEAWGARAARLLRLGKYEDVLSCVTEAEQSGAVSPVAFLAKAETLTLLDRHPEAITACDTVLSINPNSVAALTVKGRALHLMHDDESSYSCLTAALAIDPVDPNANLHLGSLLVDTGRHKNALPHLDQCLASIRHRGRPGSRRLSRWGHSEMPRMKFIVCGIV